MSRYRTTEEIYHYDRFKLLVLLLLLAALLGLILFSDQLGLEPDVVGVPGTDTGEVMLDPNGRSRRRACQTRPLRPLSPRMYRPRWFPRWRRQWSPRRC